MASPFARCIAVLAVAILSALAPAAAPAFTYSEHYAITLGSLDAACQIRKEAGISEREQSAASLICGSGLLRSCLAHMTALAGDYTKESTELYKVWPGLMVGDAIDCDAVVSNLSLLEVLEPDVPTLELPEITLPDAQLLAGKCEVPDQDVLVASWRKRMWRWVTLAMSNADHFQPQSATSWKATVRDLSENLTESPHWLATKQAFALHYLEDSFSAGHIGLDRRAGLGLRQDYSHAYHDDLNRAGQVLANELEKPWFSYGDGNLCTQTLYLDVAPNAGINWSVNSETLMTLFGRGVTSRDRDEKLDKADVSEFAKLLARVINSTGASGSGFTGIRVASLPVDSKVLLICNKFMFCDKLEVLIGQFSSKHSDRNPICEQIADDGAPSPRLRLYGCRDTAIHVLSAATHAQLAFLLQLDGHTRAAKDVFARASERVPTRYGGPQPELTLARPNAETRSSLLLDYAAPEKSVGEFVDFPHDLWGFDRGLRRGHREYLNEYTVDFGVERRLSEKWPVAARFALLTLQDDSLAVMDQAELTWEVFRLHDPWSHVFAVTPIVQAGVNSLLDGPSKRNLFGGVGIGLEFHVGRFIVQLKGSRAKHWPHDDGPEQMSTRVTIGLKIPSMRLL
ncbi:MAG: hypothetical protein ABW171_01805 [Steroidobacter sp.]